VQLTCESVMNRHIPPSVLLKPFRAISLKWYLEILNVNISRSQPPFTSCIVVHTFL